MNGLYMIPDPNGVGEHPPFYQDGSERLHMLMESEDALCALITDPENAAGFFDRFMEWRLKLLEKMKDVYKPDIIMFHDDWARKKTLPFLPIPGAPC